MTIKVQHNSTITPIEKIISVLSYISLGIIGLIVMLIAYSQKKRLRTFLNYNVVQSVVIGVFLAIFKCVFDLILTIFSKIAFLDFIAASINILFSFEIIRIYNLSFSLSEIFVYILLIYIIVGVVLGRIFYIPFLSDFIAKAVKKSEN